MTKTGITAHAVAIIGALLTFLGVRGIDSSLISSLVQGISAAVTIIAALVAYYSHSNAVKTSTAKA